MDKNSLNGRITSKKGDGECESDMLGIVAQFISIKV